ncbi:glycine-rich domain-containing protein [Pseudomonas abyssi]|uniref:glycine-rich domain-containing protein n=1 Tax=Pseudomonas abyssi TaxID=170540 RepID=UPI003C7CBC9A
MRADNLIPLALAAIVLFVLYMAYRKARHARRERSIDSYRFPESIAAKVGKTYPHLNDAEVMRVMQGLREYFHLCNMAGRRMVSMPSQAVDVAWHEFILFTRKYEHFCGKALGRFLHHTPAEAMRSPTSAQAGIKTAWRLSCLREGMQPRAAYRLPLLFAIDAELNIPDGFRYSLDCKRSPGDDYCAGHIGCSSGCGGGCGGDSSGGDGGCGGGGD